MVIGMGIGTMASGPVKGAVKPPPPPPPPRPPFFTSSTNPTSIRSASTPAGASAWEGRRRDESRLSSQARNNNQPLPATVASSRPTSCIRWDPSPTHHDHRVRFIGHAVIFGNLNKIPLHQDFGRCLYTKFVHQLEGRKCPESLSGLGKSGLPPKQDKPKFPWKAPGPLL